MKVAPDQGQTSANREGENKMDKLPDEILIEVFNHLPSLRDKLRVEGVSHRFQRCLIQLMNTKPQTLEFDASSVKYSMFLFLPWTEFLNGYPVRSEQLSEHVSSLAKKSKFSSVVLRGASIEQVNLILTALVSSDNDCLDKVSSFQIWSRPLASLTLLNEVLTKCTKLSELRLYFHIKPLDDGEFDEAWLDDLKPWYLVDQCPKELDSVLKDKQLTQLGLVLQSYSTQQVVQLYASIKPNMLKQVDLHLRTMTLDMDMLVTGLCGGAWSALEQLNLRCQMVYVQMDTLFSSLAHLPALKKCNFTFHHIEPKDQLVSGLKALFKNKIEIKVAFDYMNFEALPEAGCHFVPIIRQVQEVHPDVEVGFGGNGSALTLTLGKVSFEFPFKRWGRDCHNADCPDCAIFYPRLITLIVVNAIEQDPHLAHGRLDRCRISSVVADVNKAGEFFNFKNDWRALHAEMNEEQNLVTITFEEWGEWGDQGLFQMTVDCGHCLNNICFGCLNVG